MACILITRIRLRGAAFQGLCWQNPAPGWGTSHGIIKNCPIGTTILYYNYTSMAIPLYEQLVDGDYHWNAETYDVLEQPCPFGKNSFGPVTGRYHLYLHETCCFFAPVSSPSLNQPTNGKRTSMYGSISIPFIQPLIEIYSYEKV